MDTCFVTAKLTAKKGMEAQLEAEVVKNFLFYEIWESPEALDAHGKTPHMLAYKERTKELLACPTVVTVWSQVDCR